MLAAPCSFWALCRQPFERLELLVPWKNRLRIWLPRILVLSLVALVGLNYFFTHYICINADGVQRACGAGDAIKKLGSVLNGATRSPLFLGVIVLGAIMMEMVSML